MRTSPDLRTKGSPLGDKDDALQQQKKCLDSYSTKRLTKSSGAAYYQPHG